ncbi:NUCLEAR FUSION DEFECTIVE protein [Salix suchowensis]|nr:NUCLEAR FUSION DEFECTIVE protein [Salix suchowensis]
MASLKVVSRLSTRLQPFLFKLNKKPLSAELSSLKSSSLPTQLPLQLSCVESMLPLHSAIASATLISSLSSESDSWALVPQGVSMPL